MFNGLVLNPAYAGANEVLHTTALLRRQWTGYPAAPTTATFSLDAPLRDRHNNFGLWVSHDQIGVQSQQAVNGIYAFRFPLVKGTLSFGLQAGLHFLRIRYNDVYIVDPGDNQFAQNSPALLSPRFGFGSHFETKNFYMGFSVPELITSGSYLKDPNYSNAILERFYFFYAGARLKLSPELALKPSLLLKYESPFSLQTDLALQFVINDRWWMGGGYRTNGDAYLLASWQINLQMRLGYSYELNTGPLRYINAGSHGISITYDFGYQVNTNRPRYF